jgi:hypothetical protein
MDSKMTTYSEILTQWLSEFTTRMNGGRSLDYELVTDNEHYHYK